MTVKENVLNGLMEVFETYGGEVPDHILRDVEQSFEAVIDEYYSLQNQMEEMHDKLMNGRETEFTSVFNGNERKVMRACLHTVGDNHMPKGEQYDLYHNLQDDENYREKISSAYGEFFDKNNGATIILYGIDKTVKELNCISIKICPETEAWQKAKKAGLI
nr:MAG: hypothetical protein [Lokiarchaeota virus Ratatoskr Meg22_1012]